MELIKASDAVSKYGLTQLFGKKCAFVETVYANGTVKTVLGELVDPADCQIDEDTDGVTLFLEVPDGDDYRLAFIQYDDDVLLGGISADSEYSDTEQPEPTVADYRELQRQYDALQTELFNARQQLLALDKLKAAPEYIYSELVSSGYLSGDDNCRNCFVSILNDKEIKLL